MLDRRRFFTLFAAAAVAPRRLLARDTSSETATLVLSMPTDEEFLWLLAGYMTQFTRDVYWACGIPWKYVLVGNGAEMPMQEVYYRRYLAEYRAGTFPLEMKKWWRTIEAERPAAL